MTMNKPFKLAFFGDAICSESRAIPQVRTFVDIILKHYGADVTLVNKGTGGGITNQNILEQIKACDMDIACVFYAPADPDGDSSIYQNQQQAIESELKSRNIACVHFIYNQSPNKTFSHGVTDNIITNFVVKSKDFRVNAPYDQSDNGIDFVGNNLAAERIIKYIDALVAA